MSLKPGIGAGWFRRFASDVYPGDFVVVRGRKMRPPAYYDRLAFLWHDLLDEQVDVDTVLHARFVASADASQVDRTRERLAVREKVKLAQISRLVRDLD